MGRSQSRRGTAADQVYDALARLVEVKTSGLPVATYAYREGGFLNSRQREKDSPPTGF